MTTGYIKCFNFFCFFFLLILATFVTHAENVLSEYQLDDLSKTIYLKPLIVTAQKRPEASKDVPISMTIFSGEQLDEYNINQLDDLSTLIPGLTITQAATTTRIFLRGVGSGANHGFEQSVGTFVDDIYYARTRQLRLPLFDTEQVEVLRGPQGTVYGKNTVAGAINIRTKEPTDYFVSGISAFHELEDNEYQVSGIMSGPLNDKLKARVAVRVGGMEGFLHNSLNGNDEPNTDYYTVRGKFQWLPQTSLEVTGKYERNQLDVAGRNIQIIKSGTSLPLFTSYDPSFEEQLNGIKSTGGLGNEKSKTSSNLGMLRMKYVLNDFSFISLSGFTDYHYNDDRDVDFSPVPLLFQRETQSFSQFSQEIRLLSPDTTSLKYLLGAYYQQQDLDNKNNVDANFSLPFIGLPQSATRQINFDQDSWTAAMFGRVSYDLTDQLIISAGLRYSYEEKTVHQSLQFNNFKTTNQSPVLESIYQAAKFGTAHQFEGKASYSFFTPSVSLQYYLRQKNTMLYATYVEGSKSGGFNEAETFASQENFEFEPEYSKSVEIGSKNVLFNGDAHINLGLFYTRYKDLQASAFNGVDFIVGNAAQSSSKGVELDMDWRITDGLTVLGTLNWLNSRYDDFSNASCTAAQELASGVGSSCTQDLSGKSTQFAPEYSGTLSLNYWHPIPNSMVLATRVDVPFSSGFYVAEDLDQAAYQSSSVKLNARIALSSADDQWEIAIVGKNLSNELTISHGDDVPILKGAHFGMIERPRTISFNIKVNF